MNILRFDDYPAEPWKNGQGVTRNIARLTADDTGFIWRLSLADVGESGAFSEFNGYDRTITLLEGAGFSLNFADGATTLLDTLHAPYDFDGGAPLMCALLDGPCRDLNLMVRRDKAAAVWSIDDLTVPLVLGVQPRVTQLVFCLQGVVHLATDGGDNHALTAWDSVVLAAGETLALASEPGAEVKIFHATIGMW